MGQVGKQRSALAVILLGIVTLGIYSLYWQYATFKEMKDYSGRGIGGWIGLLLAFLLGVVNWFLMPSEVAGLYESAGRERPVSAVTGFWVLLPIVGGIVWVVKVQGALNRFWESAPGARLETP
ncbi:MAG: DUF4234 domain-containing protein [Acidimicrobiia bacterium]|nr:DUF4234 domain-containing protein [Acidimicrobiia bacterium]